MAEAPHLRVALVEPTTLVGRELRRALAESGLIVTDPVLLDRVERGGTLTAYGDEPVLVQALDDASFETVDVAFFCGSSDLLKESLPMLTKHGVLAVDVPGEAGLGALRLAGVNEAKIKGDRLVRSPTPAAILLTRVLGAVSGLGRARVDSLVFLPAASSGQAGLEELHAQTVGILNVGPVPQEVFPRQLAFNLYPAEDGAQAGARLAAEIEEILGDAAPEMATTLLRVPLFIALTELIVLDILDPPQAAAVERAIAATSGLKFVASSAPPSALEQAESDGDESLVSVLPDQGGKLRLWCVGDYFRLSVRNALDLVAGLVARGELRPR